MILERLWSLRLYKSSNLNPCKHGCFDLDFLMLVLMGKQEQKHWIRLVVDAHDE